MRISTSMRWLVVAVSAAMLLAVVAACSAETIEVPGETVVVKEEVIKTVEVPGETVVKEVIKEVMVPGETVVVEKEVIKEVQVPGETVVVKEEVIKTVEVPGETVTVEVVKTVEVPGETVVVEKEVSQDRRGPWPDRGGGERGRERGADGVCDRPHHRRGRGSSTVRRDIHLPSAWSNSRRWLIPTLPILRQAAPLQALPKCYSWVTGE